MIIIIRVCIHTYTHIHTYVCTYTSFDITCICHCYWHIIPICCRLCTRTCCRTSEWSTASATRPSPSSRAATTPNCPASSRGLALAIRNCASQPRYVCNLASQFNNPDTRGLVLAIRNCASLPRYVCTTGVIKAVVCAVLYVGWCI